MHRNYPSLIQILSFPDSTVSEKSSCVSHLFLSSISLGPRPKTIFVVYSAKYSARLWPAFVESLFIKNTVASL